MSSREDNKNAQPGATSGSRWKDPEFVRKYYRDLYKKRNGGHKLHPYILEDGRRYKDVYEFPPEFQSKDEYEAFKKERNKAYTKGPRREVYVPIPKTHCDFCNVDIHHGKWNDHLKSLKHTRNVALLEKFGVKTN